MRPQKKYSLLFVTLLACLVVFCDQCAAQAKQEDYVEWLNHKIKELVAARVTQRSNTNQTEATVMSGNSTSLVDQSSVSDLVGVALNLADLSGASVDNKKSNSASATVTAYAIFSGLKGINPLDPSLYSKYRGWRSVSLTFGYDNEKDDATGASTDRATLIGTKLLLWNRRDASHPCFWDAKLKCYSDSLQTVTSNLKKATGAFSRIDRALRKYLYQNSEKQLNLKEFEKASDQDKNDFENERLSDAAKFQGLLNLIGPNGIKEMEKLIEKELDPFQSLDDSAIKAIEKIRRAPQFSISFQSKLRKNGSDDYLSEMIFDYGIHPRINFTANGAFQYANNKTGSDRRGGKVSAQFVVQLTPESRLEGRKPIQLSFAGDGKWMTKEAPTYKGQIKLSIPVFDGIDFPVSLTFASRTDLIKEKDVRGQFGFTFDLSRLIAMNK